MIRRALSVAAVCVTSVALLAQSPDKELVATITGPALARGIVSELAWDGGTLIIQAAALEKDGTLSAKYFTAAGPRMELRQLASAPPGIERYWKMKSSPVSPTGLGRLVSYTDSKLPIYGIGAITQRMRDASIWAARS